MLRLDSTEEENLNKCGSLSERQKQVLSLFAKHQRAKEIARLLKISEHTVWAHVNEAKQRLGVTSTRDAAVLFLKFEAESSLPNDWEPQSLGISPSVLNVANSSHGHSKPNEINIHHDHVGGSRAGVVVDGIPREMPGHSGNYPDHSQGQRNGIPATSYFHDDSSDSLAHRRFSFGDQFQQLGLIQWFGLCLAVTIGIIFVVGLAMVGLLGIFQIVQQLSGQPG